MPGWRTKRRIVVIESDDWGSIRMPSRKVFNSLLQQGVRVDNCPYCSYDALATEADLAALFETLDSIRDSTGMPAVLTANAVVANPDFERIRIGGFNRYFYRTIDESLAATKGCERSFDMWNEGRKRNVFFMQSHGREHLNTHRWLASLREGDPETRIAFDLGVFGLSNTIAQKQRKSFMAAFDFDCAEEETVANTIASDGLQIFNRLFGYHSKSFIAPNYVWSRSLEKELSKEHVLYIQGNSRSRFVGDRKAHTRVLGSRNQWGQRALVRNAIFEPTLRPSENCIDSCLAEIRTAFKWHKPAVICTHRVNFSGAIVSANRDKNIRAFSQLLSTIVKVWPDVEFMTSVELGDLIND